MEVLVRFATTPSSKLVLAQVDSAAGAPSGPCCSSEVVSLLLIWRRFFLFPKGKFSCWFKEEERVAGGFVKEHKYIHCSGHSEAS